MSIPVTLADHSYHVMIGSGVLADAGQLIRTFCPRQRTVIITDTTVAAHWLAPLQASLAVAGITATVLALPPGEKTKDMAALTTVLHALVDAGVERSDAILALGGGVIGDLAGFAAAILRRGTGFVQIPTTLLAQVDSSVGGKTAINLPQGKNLVGAFHQPVLVLADTDTLDTLPPRELRAGYAEVVKYGLINNAEFFSWCEAQGAALLAGDPAARAHAISTCVAAKAAIVAQDPRETLGVRALLNLGHTFGHALEAELGYDDTLLHGEAVAMGLQLAFDFSVGQALCPPLDAERLRMHLAAVGLGKRLRHITQACGQQLVAHMAQDKKRSHGRLPFVLTRGIGQAFVDNSVDIARVEYFLDQKAQ